MDLLHDFYTIESSRIKITYKVFWKLLQATCPTLYGLLIEESMVSCSIFLLGWILTLYSGTFEIGIVSAIWDQIFLFGQDHIMRVALAVCKIVEEKSLRLFNEMSPEQQESFDMLKEVRDCNRHVTDAAELVSVVNKLSKTFLSLDVVRQTYKQAEALDSEFLHTSTEWQWSA